MQLNWLAYTYNRYDGYGRYSEYMIAALQRAGVSLTPHFIYAAEARPARAAAWGIDWSRPTISCLPPFHLRKLPVGAGPHWLLTMTEGSECPDGWAQIINESGVERVIVPCAHNAAVFKRGGVNVPISVIPGGTDPDEFALLERQPDTSKPYTFLALADRGARKGWDDVYEAFYHAFGGKETGIIDVRLVIKCLPNGNDLITDHLMHIPDLDKRLRFDTCNYENMADLYAQVDCFVIPSRSEGWGLPHREAATMGLPVITQAYGGLDDGHTDEWAIVVEGGHMEPMPLDKRGHVKGVWRVCDREELATIMWHCYASPEWASAKGQQAAGWLRAHQTWAHSAQALLQLLQSEGVLREGVYA
jgi:hypothetical protein